MLVAQFGCPPCAAMILRPYVAHTHAHAHLLRIHSHVQVPTYPMLICIYAHTCQNLYRHINSRYTCTGSVCLCVHVHLYGNLHQLTDREDIVGDNKERFISLIGCSFRVTHTHTKTHTHTHVGCRSPRWQYSGSMIFGTSSSGILHFIT